MPRELLDEVRRYYEEGRERTLRPKSPEKPPLGAPQCAYEEYHRARLAYREWEASPNRRLTLLTAYYPHWGQVRGTIPPIDPTARSWIHSVSRYADVAYDPKRCTYWVRI